MEHVTNAHVQSFFSNYGGVKSMALSLVRDHLDMVTTVTAISDEFFDRWALIPPGTILVDLCAEYGISNEVRGLLINARLMYFIHPITIGKFLTHCYNMTISSKFASLGNDERRQRAVAAAHIDYLEDLPAYRRQVHLLMDLEPPSAEFRDYMAVHQMLKKYDDLISYLINYSAVTRN